MKAIVSGGMGFFRSNIVRDLLTRNISTVVLVDLSSGFRENLISEATFSQELILK